MALVFTISTVMAVLLISVAVVITVVIMRAQHPSCGKPFESPGNEDYGLRQPTFSERAICSGSRILCAVFQRARALA